jgi:ATP-dependent DNA helicase RecQ
MSSISATCSGKSLTLWMALLVVPEGIQIVVAPLNILSPGQQNVNTSTKVGISVISDQGYGDEL